MNEILQIFKELTNNDVFVGLVGASVIMSVLYLLKGIPDRIISIYKRFFTMYVNVKNDSEIFDWVLLWIHHSGILKNSKRIDAYFCQDTRRWLTTPAEGTHYVWYKGRLIIIERSIDDTKGKTRAESISLRVIGTSRKIVDDIMEYGSEKYTNKELTQFFSSDRDGYWDKTSSKKARPMGSIFIPEEQKTKLINDIHEFSNREQWYNDMGLTHRRGYLFFGPPGTGKTSLAAAIAGLFKKDIYKISLGAIDNDSALTNAFGRVNAGSIILLEDIDAMGSSAVNSRDSEETSSNDGITLSGLLNVLDGVDSIGRGTLVIMTTNYPEKLDSALIRPGRCDVKINLGKPCDDVRKAMFLKFFPDCEDIAGEAVKATEGMTQAEIQALFVEHLDNPNSIIWVDS